MAMNRSARRELYVIHPHFTFLQFEVGAPRSGCRSAHSGGKPHRKCHTIIGRSFGITTEFDMGSWLFTKPQTAKNPSHCCNGFL